MFYLFAVTLALGAAGCARRGRGCVRTGKCARRRAARRNIASWARFAARENGSARGAVTTNGWIRGYAAIGYTARNILGIVTFRGGMADHERAARFRELAAKLRSELAHTKDEAMRRTLGDLAAQYERLADWVERQK